MVLDSERTGWQRVRSESVAPDEFEPPSESSCTDLTDAPSTDPRSALLYLPELKLVARLELPTMLRIAGPSVIVTFFSYFIWFLNTVFASQELGEVALAAVSLGSLSQNLCGFSIIVGVLGPVDTIAPQAVGAQQHEEVGIVTQLGLCASMLCYVPVAFLWLNIEPLFIALGQPIEVAALAGRYLRIAIIGLPARIVFELYRKFLGAQRLCDARVHQIMIAE